MSYFGASIGGRSGAGAGAGSSSSRPGEKIRARSVSWADVASEPAPASASASETGFVLETPLRRSMISVAGAGSETLEETEEVIVETNIIASISKGDVMSPEVCRDVALLDQREDAVSLSNQLAPRRAVVSLTDTDSVSIDGAMVDALSSRWIAIPPRESTFGGKIPLWGSKSRVGDAVNVARDRDQEMMNDWAASGGASVIASAMNLTTGTVVAACFPRMITRRDLMMHTRYEAGAAAILDIVWSTYGTHVQESLASTLANEIQDSVGSTLMTKQLARLRNKDVVTQEYVKAVMHHHGVETTTLNNVVDERTTIPVFNSEFDALFAQLFAIVKILSEKDASDDDAASVAAAGAGEGGGALRLTPERREMATRFKDVLPLMSCAHGVVFHGTAQPINAIKSFVRQIQLFYRSDAYLAYRKALGLNFPALAAGTHHHRGGKGKGKDKGRATTAINTILTPYCEARFDRKDLVFFEAWRKRVYAEVARLQGGVPDVGPGPRQAKYQPEVVAEAKLWLDQFPETAVESLALSSVATVTSEVERVARFMADVRATSGTGSVCRSQFNNFLAEVHALVTKTLKKASIVSGAGGVPKLDGLSDALRLFSDESATQGSVRPLVFVFKSSTVVDAASLLESRCAFAQFVRKENILPWMLQMVSGIEEAVEADLEMQVKSRMWQNMLAIPVLMQPGEADTTVLVLVFPSNEAAMAVTKNADISTAHLEREKRARKTLPLAVFDAENQLRFLRLLAAPVCTQLAKRYPDCGPIQVAPFADQRPHGLCLNPAGQFTVWSSMEEVLGSLSTKAREFSVPVKRIAERLRVSKFTWTVFVTPRLAPDADPSSGVVLRAADGSEFVVSVVMCGDGEPVMMPRILVAGDGKTINSSVLNTAEMTFILANELLVTQTTTPYFVEQAKASGVKGNVTLFVAAFA